MFELRNIISIYYINLNAYNNHILSCLKNTVKRIFLTVKHTCELSYIWSGQMSKSAQYNLFRVLKNSHMNDLNVYKKLLWYLNWQYVFQVEVTSDVT